MINSLDYVVVFVAILCFFIFIHLWRRNRKNTSFSYWPIIRVLLGVSHNLSSNPYDYITKVLKRRGGTLKFKGPWFTNINFVLTSDPMNVHHITSKNFGNYGKGSDFHEIFEVFGEGIFNSDSQKWKYNRDTLHTLFKNNLFESFYMKVIHKKLESCLIPFLNEASKAGTQVDLQDIFQRFTFDNICSIVLQFDPNCLPNKSSELSEVAYEKAFNKMEDAIFYRHIAPRYLWKLQKWLRIGKEKDFNESQKIVDQFLHERISCRREEQIRSTFNLLAAGRDTISAGLSWFFWLVATHPLVEGKILHGAICEALRLFPPVPFEHKCCIKSDILPSGEHINPNTMVLYSLYSMGRMEQTWGKDCLEFKPERWISEKGNNIHVPSYKFIAFNAGPRSCLGKNISLIQMKIIAIAMLWNFHLQVVEGHPVCPSVSMVLHMKHGLKVKVTKRSI